MKRLVFLVSAALAILALVAVPALAAARHHWLRDQSGRAAAGHYRLRDQSGRAAAGHYRLRDQSGRAAAGHYRLRYQPYPTPSAATSRPKPAATTLLAAPTTPAAASSSPSAASAPSTSGAASVGYNADDGTTPNYSSYSMIMANSSSAGIIAGIKSAGKVPVIYQDLTSVRTDDGGTIDPGTNVIVNGQICPPSANDAEFTATGLGFCWVWRNHPDWLLTQTGTATAATPLSQLVPENGFPTQYMVDWGNPAYQRAWAQAVIARCKALGVGWVFADNALTYNLAYTNSPLGLFPTNAAVQSATLAALKTITPALNAQGIHIIYNVGYTSMFDLSPASSLWDNWLPYSNGLTNEFPQYQGYSGDVANQKQTCLRDGKVCWFGRNGLAPEFDIVGNLATVTSG